jgi:hypothetical protein
MLVLFLASCGGNNDDALEADEISAEQMPIDSTMSQEMLQGIIKSVPSPLEMATAIKNSGAEFAKDVINNPEAGATYTTSFKKAINLGIYGADLGYINIYEKSRTAINYINAIKDLSNDLKIGQFFDFETLRRLANSNNNLDSLIYISTIGFENMDAHLREKKRGNISTLIVIGGWLEALYLATNVVENSKNKEPVLSEKIGEQKIVAEDLSFLLSAYKNEPGFTELLTDIEDLKTSFEKVNITYTYAEPETKEVDGVLVIIDNSKSTVEIPEEVLKEIGTKVKTIRSKLIK